VVTQAQSPSVIDADAGLQDDPFATASEQAFSQKTPHPDCKVPLNGLQCEPEEMKRTSTVERMKPVRKTGRFIQVIGGGVRASPKESDQLVPQLAVKNLTRLLEKRFQKRRYVPKA
jgi:hypothetical protein